MMVCCLQLCQDEESDNEENLCLNPHDAERFQSSQLGLLRVKINFCCQLSNQIQLMLLLPISSSIPRLVVPLTQTKIGKQNSAEIVKCCILFINVALSLALMAATASTKHYGVKVITYLTILCINGAVTRVTFSNCNKFLNYIHSVTSVVSWRQKRQRFIELATCRKQHQKVNKNNEMLTVQNYKLNKTKHVYWCGKQWHQECH